MVIGDNILGLIIVGVLLIIGGLAWVGLNQFSIERAIENMHMIMNSRLDALLKATIENAYGRGVADEKQRDKSND